MAEIRVKKNSRRWGAIRTRELSGFEVIRRLRRERQRLITLLTSPRHRARDRPNDRTAAEECVVPRAWARF